MTRPARLTRRTPLTRAPLRVTAEQVQRWCDSQRAARRRAADKPRTRPTRTPAETTARQLVRARSRGWCEIGIPGVCLGRAETWHHRLRASQGGPWETSNGLHACGDGTRGCHGAVTAPPPGQLDHYLRNGWVIPAWDHRHPTGISVQHARLGRVLLDNNGGWTPQQTTEDAA